MRVNTPLARNSLAVMILPVLDEQERRFRQILAWVLAVLVAAGGIIPLLPVPELPRYVQAVVPPRLAKVLLERRKQHASPPPDIPKGEQTRPETHRPPKPDKKPAAHTKPAKKTLSQVGLLAMADELAALRDAPVLRKIQRPTQKLSHADSHAKKTERSLITRNAAKHSAGIDTSQLSLDVGGAALEGHEVAAVQSMIPGPDMAGGHAQRITRLPEEIQFVFQKHKGTFDFIYNKALRQDPSLLGRVVFEITIAPSGRVTDCRILSSQLQTPQLEERFLAKIRAFDFGAKKGVDTTVVTYWIDFLQ